MKSILLLFFLTIIVGCNSEEKPKDYDDCILINMRGVDSDAGARQIRDSCRKKHPVGSEYKHLERDLNDIEISGITGTAGLSKSYRADLGYSNKYVGSLYNGNKSVTITTVLIKIITTQDESISTKEYETSVFIKPLSSGDFNFDIFVGGAGSKYSWQIVSAKGFRL